MTALELQRCTRMMLGIALAAAALAGSPSGAQAQESRLQLVQKRGKLLAGVRADYPPVGYVDKDGKLSGFGPDIASELARRMGVDVELVITKTQTRTPLLQSGAIDAEFGSTTPNKPRNETVDFSYAYAWDRMVVVVREGGDTNPAHYYNSTNVAIGGVQNSSFLENWKSLSPQSNTKGYQDYPDLISALLSKKVDVALMSEVTAQNYREQLGSRANQLSIGGAFFSDPQAIMLPRNDSDWRNWVNWGLQRLWADGTFQALYRKHFKVDPVTTPWEGGQLQPRVEEVGKTNDPWRPK